MAKKKKDGEAKPVNYIKSDLEKLQKCQQDITDMYRKMIEDRDLSLSLVNLQVEALTKACEGMIDAWDLDQFKNAKAHARKVIKNINQWRQKNAK